MERKANVFTVILAGGSGYRLWPLSRKKYPKQFLKIGSEKSLLQDTVLRNIGITDEFILVANNDNQYTVLQQMKEIKQDRFTMFLEGAGRNTAPAIALACFYTNKEDIITIVPCDHRILDQEAYLLALEEGYQLAEQGYLVTFGIKPDRPETGFGYINHHKQDVIAFKEKPNIEEAERYLQDKNYLWNSGIFIFRSGVFLEELQKYRNDIYQAAGKVYGEAAPIHKQRHFTKEQMGTIPADSIDYAVLEKSDRVKVVSAGFLWDDIGSFESFDKYLSKDENGNTISRNTICRNCRDVMAVNDASGKLLVMNDVDDLVVVNTVDATYISKAGRSQEIKDIIKENETEFNEFFLDNIRSNTPWGYYEVLARALNYQVKRITLNPGCRISLQKHFHRSEHWTVVSGTAAITIGDETRELTQNQGTYIPIGKLHRLENNTQDDVIIIEVALGERIDETDIQRFDDDYNRA